VSYINSIQHSETASGTAQCLTPAVLYNIGFTQGCTSPTGEVTEFCTAPRKTSGSAVWKFFARRVVIWLVDFGRILWPQFNISLRLFFFFCHLRFPMYVAKHVMSIL
jgi:hypothetical protein